MTEVKVRIVGDLPLVEFSGPLIEKNGAELAAKVMNAIHFMSDEGSECPHPLSLTAPRLMR